MGVIRYGRFWFQMVATVSTIFAVGAPANCDPGCWVQGKEEILSATKCVAGDNKEMILTLCSGKRCKTTLKPTQMDKPCPDSNRAIQEVAIIYTFGSSNKLFINGTEWDLSTFDSASTLCIFNKELSCSTKNDVLLVRADKQSLLPTVGMIKTNSSYKYVLATPESNPKAIDLYNISNAKWLKVNVIRQEDLPKCE